MVNTMRRLDIDEIEKLASRRGVRKIAVENFLISVTANPDRECAINNTYYDARLYKWNNPTVQAILDGISMACKTRVMVE